MIRFGWSLAAFEPKGLWPATRARGWEKCKAGAFIFPAAKAAKKTPKYSYRKKYI
jgi:hypothetical protein